MNTTLLRSICLALFLAGLSSVARSGDSKPQGPATREAPSATVKKISLDEFDKMRAEPGVIVLDVRTPREFSAGHVPGAINVDWHARDFNERVEKLDKSKKILVHCMAGVRSAAATKRMNGLDFSNLCDFSGGWSAYFKAGKPVEKE